MKRPLKITTIKSNIKLGLTIAIVISILLWGAIGEILYKAYNQGNIEMGVIVSIIGIISTLYVFSLAINLLEVVCPYCFSKGLILRTGTVYKCRSCKHISIIDERL